MPDTQSQRLGKYEILAKIGKGGFATVYRARDPDLGREVALKVLDPLLMRDPAWVARFRQEARVIAALDHPRIVPIYEIGQAEGILFIAMKLLENGSLADRIAVGPLPWAEVVRLTGEIAEGLDFAHSRKVLHRDLKPANVLLDAGGHAVLTDFGFARLVADHSLSVSVSGGVVGTPAYLAPEIWEGQPGSAQTDVYALGCILYEMATGKRLFEGATPPAVMHAHFQPLALSAQWPEGTSEGLGNVLRITLAKASANRYAHPSELAVAVTGLVTDPLAKPYAVLQSQALAGQEHAARAEQATAWRVEDESALAEGNHAEPSLRIPRPVEPIPEFNNRASKPPVTSDPAGSDTDLLSILYPATSWRYFLILTLLAWLSAVILIPLLGRVMTLPALRDIALIILGIVLSSETTRILLLLVKRRSCSGPDNKTNRQE